MTRQNIQSSETRLTSFGVSRNNLSSEYVRFSARYHPSYAKIKEYVYNSIEYSLLSQSEKVSAKRPR